jgi:hypothetical protein
MTTITTRQGKQIEVISLRDLRSPMPRGAYVRAYCHIHGSDHQRSLSIQRASGWGHCFNSACSATVLVAEWNPSVADRLLHRPEYASAPLPSFPWLPSRRLPLALQPMLLHVTETPQPWQQDELQALSGLDEHMEMALAHSQRAQLYLAERGIPLSIALETGAGYLPPVMVPRSPEHHALLQRWAARMIFPLMTPTDQGYIGRALWRWQPGMDENVHKAVLDSMDRDKGNHGVRRWIKTNPAGWFSVPFEQLARRVIMVEGAFDRLTLLAAGFDEREVVALVGTALPVEWLPPQVHTVVLALDGDQGGQEAAQRLADQLMQEGFAVETCIPPADQRGKDWNERWRRIGQEGIRPLRAACSTLRTA